MSTTSIPLTRVNHATDIPELPCHTCRQPAQPQFPAVSDGARCTLEFLCARGHRHTLVYPSSEDAAIPTRWIA
jgi:hypothetical protein